MPNDTIPGIDRDTYHKVEFTKFICLLKDYSSAYPIRVTRHENIGKEVANPFAVALGREAPIYTENDMWELECECGIITKK
jgi:hypothetical protein